MDMEGDSWKNADFSKYKTPWHGWYFKNGKLGNIKILKYELQRVTNPPACSIHSTEFLNRAHPS